MRTKHLNQNRQKEADPVCFLIGHVKSLNKCFSWEYLQSLSVPELLTMAHPTYREYHREQIYG
jgi:23S rRNA pseudoU1915 N3-methylase RlmH